MNNIFLDDAVTAAFQQEFNLIVPSHRKTAISGSGAHFFFLHYADASLLGQTWQAVSNYIALNYSMHVDGELGNENTYLFYILQQPVEIDLKDQIESDTFSSLKIVIDGYSEDRDIVERYLLNHDLAGSMRPAATPTETPDDTLWPLIRHRTLMRSRGGDAD